MQSIFKGEIVQEIYSFGTEWGVPHIYKDLRIVEYKTFLEIDLKEPPLNKGDKFYVHETEEHFLIKDAMRGTNDTMVYFTDKILEKTVNEEFKAKAERDRDEYEKKRHEEREKIVTPQVKKSWWKQLFS